MIVKYKVPEDEKKRYDNKKILYCKVLQEQPMFYSDLICYLVKILNIKDRSALFLSKEMQKLNLLDRIKLLFIGGIKWILKLV